MIDATQIAAAMQVPCLLSGDMIQQMQLWEELYLNRAGWIRNRIRSCHIPANIAQELKRLTLTEFSATVHDGAELEQAVRRVLPKLRRKMDFGLAIGGLLLKPYFTAQGVSVDIVPQNGRFLRCGGVSGRDLYWQELLHPSGAARLFPGAADTYHTEPLFLFCQSRNTGHRMQSFRSAAVGGRAAGKGV